MLKQHTISCLFSFLFFSLSASVVPGKGIRISPSEKLTDIRADCALATASIDLAVNNVRARLQQGGDMWWDRRNGRYVVPRVDHGSGLEEVSSIYAGAIWLGGIDPGGNLKLSAQTYGAANGNTDFWPGPLTAVGVTDEITCNNWDRFFTVKATEVYETQRRFNLAQQGGTYLAADIPLAIKGWPARGNPYFESVHGFMLPSSSQGLAAFYDQDGNGLYDPLQGDFPILDVGGCNEQIVPDEMIFWIFNDAGGVHTESGGDAIQMEIQNTAFAFATNDANNNNTFYHHKLINRAIETIDSFYFGYWVDPDLGCAEDDYIGSDISRDLAYVYNQDNLDGEGNTTDCGGVPTYGDDIPAVGIDFMRGLYDVDQSDYHGMSTFMYYNRADIAPPGMGDPNIAVEFYRYLTGSWQDGTPLTRGGSGYNPGSTNVVSHAFSDYPDDPGGWSMCSESLAVADQRFVMSSGGIRLDPGAVNDIFTSVVWAPSLEYPCPEMAPLLEADDAAQALFNNCFDLLDGPDAPDLNWEEQDRQLEVRLTNGLGSNNYEENYQELDFRAPSSFPPAERNYVFEGYRLYQLANGSVNALELNDATKARLVASVDIDNGIGEIINWNPPVAGQGTAWTGSLMNPGADDQGLVRSFTITEDLFATADPELENGKPYYFMAIAYAYNNYQDFSQTNGVIQGQPYPYLQGRRNVRVYQVSPKKNIPAGSTEDVEVIRLDGIGANANFLKLADGEREKMIDGSFDGTITYQGGYAPVDVFVKDSALTKNGEYLVRFYRDPSDANAYRYKVFQPGETDTLFSDQTVDSYYEQVTPFGFNLGLEQTAHPGNINSDIRCGTIGATIETNGQPWFSGVKDEKTGPYDFIKTDPGLDSSPDCDEPLSQVDDGFFTPFAISDFQADLLSNPIISPVLINSVFDIVRSRVPADSLNNVDIVLTPDKSKWSRCIVVETASPLHYEASGEGLNIPTVGNAENFYLRKSRSVTKQAVAGKDFEAVPEADPNDFGMGWFPGYAVDVETGERLNIFFGENSVYNENNPETSVLDRINGANMIWDPTSQKTLNTGRNDLFDSYAGGQHFIYVTKQAYDECAALRPKIDDIPFRKIRALQEVTWVGFPLLLDGQELLSYAEGLIPAETTIQLRVQGPYQNRFGTGQNNTLPEYLLRLGEGVVSKTIHLPAKNEVKLSPNPYQIQHSSPLLQIEGIERGSQLRIFSLDGKLITTVSNNELTFAQGKGWWKIPQDTFGLLTSGVYLVQVQSPNGQLHTLKWVVMN